jgi:hypothetical protein
MMSDTGAVKTDTAAVIVNPPAYGTLRYDWAAADVDTPGKFFGQFELVRGGKTQNFPSDRYLVVEILEHPR